MNLKIIFYIAMEIIILFAIRYDLGQYIRRPGFYNGFVFLAEFILFFAYLRLINRDWTHLSKENDGKGK